MGAPGRDTPSATVAFNHPMPMEWSVIATVLHGPGHESALLHGLKRYGEFHATHFPYVCFGRADDLAHLLDVVKQAQAADEQWARYLARLVPIERTFHFDALAFVEQPKVAVAPLAERIGAGRFFVRIERRGMLGRVHTQEAEREVADHLIEMVEARGAKLVTDFNDPDWIVVCETLDAEAGIALLDRTLRDRYPFIQVR